MPKDAADPQTRSRRSVLAAAVGGAAALAATSIARPLAPEAASTPILAGLEGSKDHTSVNRFVARLTTNDQSPPRR